MTSERLTKTRMGSHHFSGNYCNQDYTVPARTRPQDGRILRRVTDVRTPLIMRWPSCVSSSTASKPCMTSYLHSRQVFCRARLSKRGGPGHALCQLPGYLVCAAGLTRRSAHRAAPASCRQSPGSRSTDATSAVGPGAGGAVSVRAAAGAGWQAAAVKRITAGAPRDSMRTPSSNLPAFQQGAQMREQTTMHHEPG